MGNVCCVDSSSTSQEIITKTEVTPEVILMFGIFFQMILTKLKELDFLETADKLE
jgi:hypothetical protein